MTVRGLINTVAAESTKLRGLPSVLAAVAGTVLGAIVLSAAGIADPVPYLQVGTVLIGVLAAASEYAGRQIRTTLTATPNRLVLLAGKGVAVLAATAVTAVAAELATVGISLTVRGVAPEPGPVGGAVLYLVLIGLLGFGLALLLRSSIAPLVTMLCLLFVAPPLLSGVRWFPDRAGRLLYLPDTDPVLTPVTGALVVLAWIAVVGVAATIAFRRRDA